MKCDIQECKEKAIFVVITTHKDGQEKKKEKYCEQHRNQWTLWNKHPQFHNSPNANITFVE